MSCRPQDVLRYPVCKHSKEGYVRFGPERFGTFGTTIGTPMDLGTPITPFFVVACCVVLFFGGMTLWSWLKERRQR